MLQSIVASGWEQPNWFALPGDEAGYKPSYRRTNWFEPVGREVRHVMEHCGVIDLTPFGKLEISGPDAHAFIDQLCANNVPKVSHLRHYFSATKPLTFICQQFF